MLVRKSWATPRHAADKGLLLRDTKRDIAADAAACASWLTGRGRDHLRPSREEWRRLVKARRQRAATMQGVGNRPIMRNGQNKPKRRSNNHPKSHTPIVPVYQFHRTDSK